ncbi:hypothetical protein AMTRI_Chr04g181790 [Amborella trichopoda]
MKNPSTVSLSIVRMLKNHGVGLVMFLIGLRLGRGMFLSCCNIFGPPFSLRWLCLWIILLTASFWNLWKECNVRTFDGVGITFDGAQAAFPFKMVPKEGFFSHFGEVLIFKERCL